MALVPATGAIALEIAITNGTSAISVTTTMMASAASYLNEEPPAFCVSSIDRGFRLMGSNIALIQLIADRSNTEALSLSMCVFRKEQIVPFRPYLVARETRLMLGLIDRFAIDEPAKTPATRRCVFL
jgi:hypothetical protein